MDLFMISKYQVFIYFILIHRMTSTTLSKIRTIVQSPEFTKLVRQNFQGTYLGPDVAVHNCDKIQVPAKSDIAAEFRNLRKIVLPEVRIYAMYCKE